MPSASHTRLEAVAHLLVTGSTLPELHGGCRRGRVASPDRLQQSHHCVIHNAGLQAGCGHSPICPLCCTQKAGSGQCTCCFCSVNMPLYLMPLSWQVILVNLNNLAALPYTGGAEASGPPPKLACITLFG